MRLIFSEKIKAAKHLIPSVWVLGLIIAVPVIIFMPDLFNKYKTSLFLQESAAHQMPYRIYFRDLDGNGVRQKIYSFQNGSGQLAFQYFGDDGRMMNQINFKKKYSSALSYLVFADADENGLNEVYGFTIEKDSLFLNWKEKEQ